MAVNDNSLLAQGLARSEMAAFWSGMGETFQRRRRRARAVVNSVVRDSAGRVSGALASIDGSNDQAMLVDHGQPINTGDVFVVVNDGSVTIPQWRALRKLSSTSAIPNAGELPTMPTPTGLTLTSWGSSLGAPGLPVWSYVFATWDIIDPALYGGTFDYELEYATDETIHSPASQIIIYDQPTTTLSHAILPSDTLIPRNPAESYGHARDDFPFIGDASMAAEEFSYTSHTAGYGDAGSGTGGSNRLTDASAVWATDYWKNYILIDATGKKFRITGNDQTVLYVSGATASGTYYIQPGFCGCTRGINGTSASSFSAGQSIISESVGAMLSGLEPGSALNVRLRARRYDGALSGWTAWQSVTVYSDNIPPITPTNFDVESTGTGALLTWDSPTLSDTPDLVGFYIWESDDDAGTNERYRGAIGPRTQTLVHLSSYNNEYYFCVQAVDSSGNTSAKTERLSGRRLPVSGVNVLPNSDLEIVNEAGTLPRYWDNVIYGDDGTDAEWGDYGMLGGKGIRITCPRVIDTSLVTIGGPAADEGWLIYAEVGMPYVASLYFKTSSTQVVFDYADIDATHKHWLWLGVAPYNGSNISSTVPFTRDPAVVSETGDGWKRLRFNFEVNAADWGMSSGFYYIYFYFGAENYGTQEFVVDIDRLQLEVAEEPSAWASSAAVPPGQGLRIDPTGIVGTYLTIDGYGMFGSHLVPKTDLTYDLGRSDKRWKTLYAGTIIADEIQGLTGLVHDAVTLSAGAGVFLDISGQEIGVDTQTANTIFAGPVSGGDAAPTFRTIVSGDFGAKPANYFLAGPTSGGDAAPTWRAIDAADLPGGASHSAATLDSNANTILSLTDQEFGLDAQSPNSVWAGPASGGSAVPSFRSLVVLDLPAHASAHLPGGSDVLTTAAASTLSVSTTNATGTNASLARSDHLHTITTSSNPGAAASILASDASGYLTLKRIGLNTSPSYPVHISTTATHMRMEYDSSNYADLYADIGGAGHLDPTGDIIVDPVGKDVRPERTYDLNLGTQQHKWLTLWAGELNVDTLVARDVISTIGGRIVIAPSTYLTRDLSPADTTIYVAHNQLQNGDIVWMEGRGRLEFMEISSSATESPEDLTNGGFDSSLTGWTQNAGTGSIIRVTGTTHDGSGGALRLTSGSTFNTYVYQTEGVTAGQVYSLRFWYTDDTGSSGIRFLVYDETANGDIISLKELPEASTSEFAYHETRFTVPSGCTSVGIYLYCPRENGARAYFDDVSLKLQEYSYSVNRDEDGTGANWWYAGDGVVNTGSAGDGFIDAYSDWSIGGRPLTYIFNYDTSAGTYSDNYALAANWTMFPTGGYLNDCVYFGVHGTKWDNLFVYLKTAGSYNATITYEYYNGSWTSFTPDINNSWEQSGPRRKTWDSSTDLSGWMSISVNGHNAYWIRARVSARTSWSTNPAIGVRRAAYDKGGYGPTIVGNVRQSSVFNDWETRWVIGNMDGHFGVTGHNYGIGLGDYSGGNYLVYDEAAGFRMRAGDDSVLIDPNGVTFETPTSAAWGDFLKWRTGGDYMPGAIFATYDPSYGRSLFSINALGETSAHASAFAWVQIVAAGGADAEVVASPASRFELYTYLNDSTQSKANVDVHDVTNVISWYTTYATTASNYDYRVDGGISVGDNTRNPGIGDVDYTGDLTTYKDSSWRTGYIYVPLTTPWTGTSFDGDYFSTVGSSTSIDVSSEFGVPASAAAIVASIVVQDSGTWGGGEYTFWLGPTSTYYYALGAVCYGGGYKARNQGIVPIDASGNIYYRCSASGSNTMQAWIRIWGYFI